MEIFAVLAITKIM